MYHLRRIERISHEKIHNSGYGISYHYITIVICPYYMTLQLPVKAAVFMMNIYIYIYIHINFSLYPKYWNYQSLFFPYDYSIDLRHV